MATPTATRQRSLSLSAPLPLSGQQAPVQKNESTNQRVSQAAGPAIQQQSELVRAFDLPQLPRALMLTLPSQASTNSVEIPLIIQIKPYLAPVLLLVGAILLISAVIIVGIIFPPSHLMIIGFSLVSLINASSVIPAGVAVCSLLKISHLCVDSKKRSKETKLADSTFSVIMDKGNNLCLEKLINLINEKLNGEKKETRKHLKTLLDLLTKISKLKGKNNYTLTFSDLKKLVFSFSRSEIMVSNITDIGLKQYIIAIVELISQSSRENEDLLRKLDFVQFGKQLNDAR